jgi:hypothetical protein
MTPRQKSDLGYVVLIALSSLILTWLLYDALA